MPRFVLLHHVCPPDFSKPRQNKPSHWDFMLEFAGKLRTWELHQLPSPWVKDSASENTDKVSAVQLADHRLAYLDYEGPLSGDRGTVSRYDRGTYELLCQEKGLLQIRLQGAHLRGTAELLQSGSHWQLSTMHC